MRIFKLLQTIDQWILSLFLEPEKEQPKVFLPKNQDWIKTIRAVERFNKNKQGANYAATNSQKF